MIRSEFEKGYIKACRDLEGWIHGHSELFGRRNVLGKVQKIIHAFGDSPDVGVKFGEDAEAFEIGGVVTINERAIAAYKNANADGVRLAFAEIEKSKKATK